MSDLVRITITAVNDNEVHCYYENIHPDHHDKPLSPTYPFQIVLELYELIKEKGVYNAAWQEFPFTKEDCDQILQNHNGATLLDEWLILLRGKKVEITKEEYETLNNSSDIPRNISSWGMSDGKYTKSFRAEFAECLGIAENEFYDIRIENVKNFPWKFTLLIEEEKDRLTEEDWDKFYDPENRPQCDLYFKVKNKDILKHMIPGSSWGSAMFNFEYYA